MQVEEKLTETQNPQKMRRGISFFLFYFPEDVSLPGIPKLHQPFLLSKSRSRIFFFSFWREKRKKRNLFKKEFFSSFLFSSGPHLVIEKNLRFVEGGNPDVQTRRTCERTFKEVF